MHSSYNQFFIPQFFVCSTRFERLDSFETCRADKKNCGKKIDYKNCQSRWLLTHCIMMHGTYNVKFAVTLAQHVVTLLLHSIVYIFYEE